MAQTMDLCNVDTFYQGKEYTSTSFIGLVCGIMLSAYIVTESCRMTQQAPLQLFLIDNT